MMSDQERQLRVMASKLDAFEKRELALSSLITDLEGLFNVVVPEDQQWRGSFWRLWGELEINYAFALDMGWKSLDDTSERLVAKAVSDLKALVAAKLDQG
jgi:hypothetical protein